MTDIPFETTPFAVKASLDAQEAVRLIDVRDPAEYALARIEGSELIPMRSISQHLQDLEESDSRLIVYCHHGIRSLSVVEWLRRQGVDNCQSMSGGIDLWSSQIDPAVPRY